MFVNRFDRTMFLANSLALKLANVTESAESTERRNREGRVWQAHGVLKGSAADLVRKVIPPIPSNNGSCRSAPFSGRRGRAA